MRHIATVLFLLVTVGHGVAWADLSPADETEIEKAILARDEAAVRRLFEQHNPSPSLIQRDAFARAVRDWDEEALADTIKSYGKYNPRFDERAHVWRSAQKPPANALARKGLSLRRAVTGKDALDPALFSYQRDIEDRDDIFTARFALLWRRPTPQVTAGGRLHLQPSASIQGVLTSEKKERVDDSWIFRGGMEGFWHGYKDPAKISLSDWNWWARAGAKYELSQDTDTRKLLLDFAVQPYNQALGMGHVIRCGTCPDFSFSWQPQGLVDFGRTVKEGDSTETETTVLRLGFNVRAELYLDGLARQLGMYRPGAGEGKGPVPGFLPYAFIDNTLRYTPLEDREWRNIFVAGFSFPFSEYASLNLEYRRGRDVPNFEKVELFTIGLGVKF